MSLSPSVPPCQSPDFTTGTAPSISCGEIQDFGLTPTHQTPAHNAQRTVYNPAGSIRHCPDRYRLGKTGDEMYQSEYRAASQGAIGIRQGPRAVPRSEYGRRLDSQPTRCKPEIRCSDRFHYYGDVAKQ